MTIHLGFGPDPQRARAIDRRMHLELAASLEYLQDRLMSCTEPVPGLDPARLDAPLARIRCGARLAPLSFIAYYDFATALVNGNPAAARESLDRLEQAQPAPPGRVHRPLREPQACARSARYADLFGGPSPGDIRLKPLPADRAGAFAARFERGMALMHASFPELAGEVDAIVHEVVAIASDPGTSMQMDGASHYRLWGALFLNADFHPTDVAMMEVIAHESAHSLLFGLCTQETLVDNDDAAVFSSPLRVDPRPMDGIYHATFVSARMHLAMARLLASGLLDDPGRAAARAAMETDRLHFEAGDSVIQRYAMLTPLGRELMDGARRYMADA